MPMDTLRNKLKEVLSILNIDSSKYSWHSFRRGGATLASQMSVDPALIKAHGRWKSEAYLYYVDNDKQRAGNQITTLL